MPHINEQWEKLKGIAREMLEDAVKLALAEYRQAYPKDMAVSSPHLPEAITHQVIVKLDDLFYAAAKALREQEAIVAAEEVGAKKKKKRSLPDTF